MIIDTSAIIAIAKNEPEAGDLLSAAREHAKRSISAATLLEVGIVADRQRGTAVADQVEVVLALLKTATVPFSEAHARLARTAYRRYGRGSGHPAQLNFGDCFAYALAIDADEPLLFKGDDFIHTDVRRALG